MWAETCSSVLCNQTLILTNSCLNGSCKHFETQRGVLDAILVVGFLKGYCTEGQTLGMEWQRTDIGDGVTKDRHWGWSDKGQTLGMEWQRTDIGDGVAKDRHWGWSGK